MSQGQGVKLGGGEQGSHQVLFVSHPQPLLDAVCVCVCVCGGLGQEFRWHGLCALITDPRSGVRLKSWGRGQSDPCSGSVVVSGVQLPGFHLCVLGPNYIILVKGVKRTPFSEDLPRE